MEIALAALFVLPATMKLGFILASCYFAGAVGTELSHNALKVNSFIPIVLLWIGAFIRDHLICADQRSNRHGPVGVRSRVGTTNRDSRPIMRILRIL